MTNNGLPDLVLNDLVHSQEKNLRARRSTMKTSEKQVGVRTEYTYTSARTVSNVIHFLVCAIFLYSGFSFVMLSSPSDCQWYKWYETKHTWIRLIFFALHMILSQSPNSLVILDILVYWAQEIHNVERRRITRKNVCCPQPHSSRAHFNNVWLLTLEIVSRPPHIILETSKNTYAQKKRKYTHRKLFKIKECFKSFKLSISQLLFKTPCSHISRLLMISGFNCHV